MKRLVLVLIGALWFSLACYAQQTTPDAPNAATPTQPTNSSYAPPTQGERFKNYLRRTYSIGSVLEAGARGGIEQARDKPSEWPQGGRGYADRFGSAMGEIATRGTTEYVIGAALGEDLRVERCRGCSLDAKFKAAFKDTFTAKKGEDGHAAFSVARLVGPISGNVVAANTWYPDGGGRSETVKGVGITYGMVFARNVIKEVSAR